MHPDMSFFISKVKTSLLKSFAITEQNRTEQNRTISSFLNWKETGYQMLSNPSLSPTERIWLHTKCWALAFYIRYSCFIYVFCHFRIENEVIMKCYTVKLKTNCRTIYDTYINSYSTMVNFFFLKLVSQVKCPAE